MVRLREIFQKRNKLKAAVFVLFLFALGYLRHLLISNWASANLSTATYSSENIAWLRAFIKNMGLPYNGAAKIILNTVFLALFGYLGHLFFKLQKRSTHSKYFIITHAGLSFLGIGSFFIARYFHFSLLETNSRDLIVFLQAPYIFVLIYFTNYLSHDKKL